MNRLRYILLLLLIAACNKSNVMVPAPVPYSLVPGECLSSSVMDFKGFRINNLSTTEEQDGLKMYVINFSLNFACRTEYLRNQEGRIKNYRAVPNDNIYEGFGANAEIVRTRYEQCRSNFFTSIGRWCDATTVILNSGAKLIADKDIAGFKAGENIVAETLDYEKWKANGNIDTPYYLGINSRDYIELPIGAPFPYQYSLSSDGLAIAIPWMGNTREVVNEDISFTFELPVRVGLYLTWINETISNPDAPFPYRDETLTCTFTIPKNLK